MVLLLLSFKVWRITGVNSGVEQVEPLYNVDGIAISYRQFIKQYADPSVGTKNGFTIWFRSITSGELESVCQKYFVVIDTLFEITKICKHMGIHQWMNGLKKELCVYNGMLFNLNKPWFVVICDNMDKSWGHYTSWNNPDTEWKGPHEFTYMWNLKTLNLKVESEMGLPASAALSGWRKEPCWPIGTNIQLNGRHKFWCSVCIMWEYSS